MRKGRTRTLVILMVALLVGVVLVQRGEQELRDTGRSGEKAFATLAKDVNAVTRIEITGASEHTTVELKDGAWQVREMAGYPASIERVRQFLYRLSETRLREEKTKKKEQYGALHLTPKLAKHVKIFTGEDAKPEADFYVGKYSSGFGGSYIRRKGEASVWLVTQDLTVDEAGASWLEPDILSLGREEVKEVAIHRSKGDNLRIFRDKPGDDFMLADVPVGAKVGSVFDLNMIASSLEQLELQQVRHVSTTMGPKFQEVTYTTFSGLEVTGEFFLLDKSVWTRISASYSASAREAYLQSIKNEKNAATLQKALASPEDVEKQAKAINDVTEHWYYMLSTKALEQLRKRKEELLSEKK